jgi:hypothetical protein
VRLDTACPAGKYKDTISKTSDVDRLINNIVDPSDECINCPLNTYGSDTGLTSKDDCKGCPLNSFSIPGSAVCLCYKGYYDSVPGATVSCSACPAGTYQPVVGMSGLSSCLACPSLNSITLGEATTNVSACLCDKGVCMCMYVCVHAVCMSYMHVCM